VTEREIDAGILEACRAGDQDAFRALYESCKDKVYSICLYFFHGDTAEAADAAQDVFLKVYANIGTFRGDAVFSTWLYRLVQNVCLDASRRKAARSRLAESQAVEPVSEPSISQEDSLSRSQAAKTVQRALSSLPPEFRMPILLRYFEEFSYEDMAVTLNCSMGTVASRLNRGHKMLAKLLGPLRGRDV
jgi:RNA polymerase sigma-70 factor (ECF subfamily)